MLVKPAHARHRSAAALSTLHARQFSHSFANTEASLRSEGPYLTYDDIRRRAEVESRRNWVVPHGFKLYSKSKPNFIGNYVRASPSQFPLLHAYREVRKEKWLAGNFRPGRYSQRRLVN